MRNLIEIKTELIKKVTLYKIMIEREIGSDLFNPINVQIGISDCSKMEAKKTAAQ